MVNLFGQQKCLNEDQVESLKAVNINTDPVSPTDSCKDKNSCGISLQELLDTYEFYEFQKGVYKSWGGIDFPWKITPSTFNLNYAETNDKWSISLYRETIAYFVGDRVLYIEDDGYLISLYEATEDIPALSPPLDRTKWDKVCSIRVSEPAQLPTIEELKERYRPYVLDLYLENWGEAESNWNEDLIVPDSDHWETYRIKKDYYYKPGDFVLIESECSDAFCLWINIKPIPTGEYYARAHAKFPYDEPVADENGVKYLYWDKLYCVNSGYNKCLGPQSATGLPN